MDYQTLSLKREKRTIGFGAFSQPVEMYFDRPAVLSREANTWKIIGRKINDGFAVLLFKCDQVRQIFLFFENSTKKPISKNYQLIGQIYLLKLELIANRIKATF